MYYRLLENENIGQVCPATKTFHRTVFLYCGARSGHRPRIGEANTHDMNGGKICSACNNIVRAFLEDAYKLIQFDMPAFIPV